VVCGALGFFVVLRRLAFVGVGISHAAVGGVALGLLLGLPPLAAGGAFGVAVALGIATASRKSRLGQDTVIGVFFSGALALGLAVASAGRGGQQDLFAYLFGNVLTIGPKELLALAGLATLVIGGLAATFRAQLFLAFDEELARAYGHRVGALDALLLVLLALTVVIGMRLVGAACGGAARGARRHRRALGHALPRPARARDRARRRERRARARARLAARPRRGRDRRAGGRCGVLREPRATAALGSSRSGRCGRGSRGSRSPWNQASTRPIRTSASSIASSEFA
jgi:hypothetical protein